MDHVSAASLMAQARDRSDGKPLQNNTRLYDRGEDDFAVRLHYTDVVTIHADGTYTLRTGGWETVTTRDRITTYAPVYKTLRSRRGDWQLRVRESVSDPEPVVRHRTVPKPFTRPDPGPEPEKDPRGCVVGHLLVRGIMDTTIFWGSEIGNDRELRANDRLKIYHPERIANAPNAARAVCEYLKQAFGSGRSIHVEHPGTERIEYVESQSHWARDEEHRMPNWRHETCPHCAAFTRQRESWKIAMHGGWVYGVNQRSRYHQGYALMVEMLEQFGTREAWQEAYIAEFRQQREDSKVHREWESRNYVRFHDGIRVDSNGYVPRKDAEEIFKAERAAKRARRRLEIEHEQRQREARQLQRFKDRVRRKRGDNFDTLVVELGNDVRAWKARLEES